MEKMDIRKMMKQAILKEPREMRSKKVFWASEVELNQFDLYHRFKGTPPTNPPTPEGLLGLKMRTYTEEAFIKELSKLDVLDVVEERQHRIEIERQGITVTGYLDGLFKTGEPLEFKTSFGTYQKYDLDNGKPKTNYLKQLAIYMDATNANKGYLVQAHFKDTFILDEIYQFDLHRDGMRFTCGSIEFNLDDVYNRWSTIWEKYIEPDIEPPSEYVYKYPLQDIHWHSLSKGKISKARNNHAVLGDYQVTYSDYKDLIIAREGSTPGYTDKELKYIKEKTNGYTKW